VAGGAVLAERLESWRASRLAYWGLPDFEDYWRHAGVWPLDPNGDILIAPLIEDAAGAAAIRDILREVRGIGCVFIGSADLATSLGYPGEPNHPEVQRVVDDIAQAAHDAGGAVRHYHRSGADRRARPCRIPIPRH